MGQQVRKTLIISLANLIVAFGIFYFWIPLKIAPGGTTGLTVILQHYLPALPISLTMAIINGILILLGFLFIGREFGGYTIYSSAILSVYMRIFEVFFPISGPMTSDYTLSVFFGALTVGIGIGLVFNEGASTGGTDIIAAILNKFTHTSIAMSLLIADLAITILATAILGVEIGMYSILGIILNSLILDKMIQGVNRRMEMMIVTSKFDEVNTFLNKEIGRGTTILKGFGGFSQKDRKVIITVLSKSQYVKTKLFLKEIDPTAFVISDTVSEVLGEGFTFEKLM